MQTRIRKSLYTSAAILAVATAVPQAPAEATFGGGSHMAAFGSTGGSHMAAANRMRMNNSNVQVSRSAELNRSTGRTDGAAGQSAASQGAGSHRAGQNVANLGVDKGPADRGVRPTATHDNAPGTGKAVGTTTDPQAHYTTLVTTNHDGTKSLTVRDDEGRVVLGRTLGFPKDRPINGQDTAQATGQPADRPTASPTPAPATHTPAPATDGSRTATTPSDAPKPQAVVSDAKPGSGAGERPAATPSVPATDGGRPATVTDRDGNRVVFNGYDPYTRHDVKIVVTPGGMHFITVRDPQTGRIIDDWHWQEVPGGNSTTLRTQEKPAAPPAHDGTHTTADGTHPNGTTPVYQPINLVHACRQTIEQQQADAWERGDFWTPPVYDPAGESPFMKGVHDDKAAAEADLAQAIWQRNASTLPGAVWDQAHGDPIAHAEQSIMRSDWMIAIYQEAWWRTANSGHSNQVSHAYAQIQVDNWRNKSLADFEQAFGNHYAALGMEISGNALGNLQKLVAECAPTVAARSVARTATTTTTTAVRELATDAAGTQATRATAPPPIQGRAASILLANDTAAASCAKVKPIRGWYSVFMHGNADQVGLLVNGKAGTQVIPVGVKSVKAAMIRTGYRGGGVILYACKAGELAEGVAQQLADELEATVWAPTTKVGVTDSGRMVMLDGGRMKPFYPTLPATP
jgi:hypothetical protein